MLQSNQWEKWVNSVYAKGSRDLICNIPRRKTN